MRVPGAVREASLPVCAHSLLTACCPRGVDPEPCHENIRFEPRAPSVEDGSRCWHLSGGDRGGQWSPAPSLHRPRLSPGEVGCYPEERFWETLSGRAGACRAPRTTVAAPRCWRSWRTSCLGLPLFRSVGPGTIRVRAEQRAGPAEQNPSGTSAFAATCSRHRPRRHWRAFLTGSSEGRFGRFNCRISHRAAEWATAENRDGPALLSVVANPNGCRSSRPNVVFPHPALHRNRTDPPPRSRRRARTVI